MDGMAEEFDLHELIRSLVEQAAEDAGATQGMVLTDWVLVAARQGFDGEADVTQVLVVPSDAPAYRHRGLLAEAVVRFDADTLHQYGPDT